MIWSEIFCNGKATPYRVRPMKYVSVNLMIAMMISGCTTTDHDPQHVHMRSEQIQSTGATLGRPSIIDNGNGLTIHGYVCRRLSTVPPPNFIVIELISNDGTFLESKTMPLWVDARHQWGCTSYHVATKWPALPDRRLRICGKRADEESHRSDQSTAAFIMRPQCSDRQP